MMMFIFAMFGAAITLSARLSSPNWIATLAREFPIGAVVVFITLFSLAVFNNGARVYMIAAVLSAAGTLLAWELLVRPDSKKADSSSKSKEVTSHH